MNTQIGFFHVWNRVAGDVAQRHGLSLIDTARTFVLLTVGLHDGLQTSFTSKFTYGLWRPVTAIRRASEDLNPATDQDDRLDAAADHADVSVVRGQRCMPVGRFGARAADCLRPG